MRSGKTRSIIALMVVGVFMLITALLAIFPLLSNRAVELSSYADFFTKTSGIYTGIVGVIIGYYFAKNTDPKETKEETTKPGE
jgi:uncharacterized membrane protein HdeD (DUF308 family)